MKTKLIKCNACGQDVSAGAAACPHCGEPVRRQSHPGAFSWRDPVHAVAAGVAIAFCAIYVAGVLIRWYSDKVG